MSYEIIEKLKKDIEGYKEKPEWNEVGRVIEVGDGIVRILGLRNAVSQEVLIIETVHGERPALALSLEEESIGGLVLGDFLSVAVGDTVRRTGDILSIEVGDELIGRVVDPLGAPQDGLGPIFKVGSKPQRNPLEQRAPGILERESVNIPLHTGIKAIDALIPIGRGQRELIIGDRQSGKTAVALDAILNQKNDTGRRTPICIYVAVGQKESKVVRIAETLKKFDAFKYSIIVSASAGSPAAMWYLAPYAGTAIGEYFRDKGMDALIVYDDLSKHAWAYRQISLLLRRPPGREAYPG
ncbi:MAG TPA: F0F1 ATP synthase subunit alpha, partial [Candidatus Paceibacterota bacterium]